MIDNSISFCSIHRYNRIQLIRHFFCIHLCHFHRRIHKRNRFMRSCRRIGTDMSGNNHISFQIISVLLHIQKFCRRRKCSQCPVSVRNKTGYFRAGTESSQATEKSDCRRIHSFTLSSCSRNLNPYHISFSFRSM